MSYQPKPVARRLLRIEDVAERLNVSRSMAWKLTNDRVLPSIRIGRCVRFRPEDIDRYINVNEP